MKTILFLIIAALSFPAFAQSLEQALVADIVNSYQEQTQLRFGSTIRLSFHDSDILQATGGRDHDGSLVISIYQGILNTKDKGFILFITCHEVGHILGNVNLKTALKPGDESPFDPLDNVEGEADYFAGACTRDFIERNQWQMDPVSVVHSAFEKLYEEKITLDDSQLPDFNGINHRYPSTRCRLLSAISGVLEQPRPHCWYNP